MDKSYVKDHSVFVLNLFLFVVILQTMTNTGQKKNA